MLNPRKRLDIPGLGRWHDLSGPIANGMWAYGPPIAPVHLEETTTHAGPRRESNFTFTLPHLAGTYLETPLHRQRQGRTLCELDMDELVRPATVLQLPALPPFSAIEAEALVLAAQGLPLETAVLISTGWEVMWEDQKYVSHTPFFSPQAMQWLITKGVKLLGADIPCFDSPVKGGRVLDDYFATGGNILAPVTGLRAVASRRVLLVMAPLPVKGVCGAPCRAFAVEWPDEEEVRLSQAMDVLRHEGLFSGPGPADS